VTGIDAVALTNKEWKEVGHAEPASVAWLAAVKQVCRSSGEFLSCDSAG
jgi:hypothetical protein